MSLLPGIFAPALNRADVQRVAGDLTNLRIYKRQLEIQQAKLAAAWRAGAGPTLAFVDANNALADAQDKLGRLNELARAAYDEGVRRHRLRPLRDDGGGGLAAFTWKDIIVVAADVAMIVASIIIGTTPVGWAIAAAAVVTAIAFLISKTADLLSTPGVGSVIKTVSVSWAFVALAGVATWLFARKRRANS